MTNEYKLKNDVIILGIETSCDETAVALVKNGNKILGEKIISSADIHSIYGGVVPELASRVHCDSILYAFKDVLKQANINMNDIDVIAVTKGAGLVGSLVVGVSFAKTLSMCLNKPLIGVNHIFGHIAASYINHFDEIKTPYIALLTSGAHTAILKINDKYNIEKLGTTIDDAIGESFDKVAKALGLGYPGGPNIDKLSINGNPYVEFPKMDKPYDGVYYNLSYSGLKTAVINYIEKAKQNNTLNINDVAASFQKTAIDTLIKKTITALFENRCNLLTISGGVAANNYLRYKATIECAKYNIKCILPEKKYCTDNAVMIAIEGYFQYLKNNFNDLNMDVQTRIDF